MSPTATIAGVIVALLFLAWLFQSPTYDPGYEAWRKRQMEMQKEQPPGEVAGPNVVDPGVAHDPRSLDEIRRDNELRRIGAPAGAAPVQAGDLAEIDPGLDPFRGVLVSEGGQGQAAGAGGHTDAPMGTPNREGFAGKAILNGTFTGVAYRGETPVESAVGEAPSITFRRDGTFTTYNMAAAEVDMEAGTALGAAINRGSGRYRISGFDLMLTYTDGLSRSKGNERTYIILPVGGREDSPTGITIQGKLFKRDQ